MWLWFAASLLLSLCLAHAAETGESKPALWMMPTARAKSGEPLKELIGRENEWANTRKVIDGVGYWASLLDRHLTDDELKQLFAKLKQWNLGFGLEIHSLKKKTPTAADAFSELRSFMDRFEPLGADVQWFAFDEPFYATRTILLKPDPYAVEEVAEFIRLIRKQYPAVRIGDIEPYPALKLDDLKPFLTALSARCSEIGVKGIDFLRLDVDWSAMNNYLPGSWTEVHSLQDWCRAQGMSFSLIYWAADYPHLEKLKLADDMTWYLGVVHQGSACAVAGIEPDECVIESWLQVPKHSVPETDVTTFTGSVLDFHNRFLKQH